MQMDNRKAAARVVGVSAIAGGAALALLATFAVLADAPPKHVGATTCNALACHGATEPLADRPGDEYLTWSGVDAHSKAFRTLRDEEQSAAIAKALASAGAGTAAGADAATSPRCLSCHAVDVPKEARGQRFSVEEGVTCEGCHGPAEKWLEPHARKGWKHEQSVALGMVDNHDLLHWANRCVVCHLAIDHVLIDAGHPDLVPFELDAQSQAVPPHWRDRYGPWFGARAWGTGQAVALRASLAELGKRAAAGAAEDHMGSIWRRALGHLAAFRHLGARVAKTETAEIERAVDSIRGLVVSNRVEGREELVAIAERWMRVPVGKLLAARKTRLPELCREAAAAADRAARKVASARPDERLALELLRALAGDGERVAAIGVRGAEQSAYGLYAIFMAALKENEGLAGAAEVQPAIEKLFEHVTEPDKFDAKAYLEDLKKVEAALKAAG